MTLPDLLRRDLDVVFVGINPSVYSAERGHYFARGSNRIGGSRNYKYEPIHCTTCYSRYFGAGGRIRLSRNLHDAIASARPAAAG